MKTPFSLNIYDVLTLIGIETSGKQKLDVCCPECDHAHKTHRKTLNINLNKGVFRCNRCGVGGGIIDLYSLFSGKSDLIASRADSYDEICARLSVPENFSNENKKRFIETKTKIENFEFSVSNIENRHKTYSILFENATLSNKHRQNLINRGLNNDFIEMAGYRTFPQVAHNVIIQKIFADGATVKGIPGLYLKNNNWTMVKCKSGIMIPVRDANKKIQGIQIRLDYHDPNQGKFKWWSSSNLASGCSAKGWCHFVGDKNCETLILTEGPLKADIINFFSKKSVLAVTGVTSLGCLQDFLFQLSNLKHVYLAFDMDWLSNKYVKKALEKVIEIFILMEIKITQLIWNSQYKGLDDFYKHISKSVIV